MILRRGLQACSAALALIGGLFAWICKARLTLPYEENGRYFDAETGVALDQDAALAYGFIAFVAFALAGALWYSSLKIKGPPA